MAGTDAWTARRPANWKQYNDKDKASTESACCGSWLRLIEAIATDTVLVLVLEDLQWSDPSTLDAVAYLAQRRRSVRLYLVGTYRPAEVVVSGHPLRQVVQELSGRRQCEELAFELFTEADVEEYLRQRFGRRTAHRRAEPDDLSPHRWQCVVYREFRGLFATARAADRSRGATPAIGEPCGPQAARPEQLAADDSPADRAGCTPDEQQLLARGECRRDDVHGRRGRRGTKRTLEEVEEIYDRLREQGAG